MSSRAFAIFLQELRDGRTHTELTTQLAALLEKVKETGKGGELTLKLKVKPAGRGSDVDKIVIADSITITLPKPERGEDFFWLTEENDLSRNHPRQQSLELRDAKPSQPTTFKEVAQ
jgi:hypothetical protein